MDEKNEARSVATTFLLEGFLGGHSRWEVLRRRVEAIAGPCRIWRYDTSGRTSLESVGAALRDELEHCATSVNLIGYSMGGIVVREAVRTLTRPIRRAVFLHSPHRGSYLSHIFPGLPACREMCPGSPFLSRLNEAAWAIPTLATWCAWDAIVIPGHSARWRHATAIVQSHVPAHAWPVFSPGIHKRVAAFLE